MPTLTKPEQIIRKPNIPIADQKKHIKKYEEIRPVFERYAESLKKILEGARNIFAPLGIVEARAKTIESFSEKIIRKDKYRNPLNDMTDLCGARVITHFSKQVHDICTFIEQNFEIDKENSIDLRSRLRTSEFGYRSIHYIVTPKKNKILDVTIANEFKTLKAEIQVRTFHEHIWADILHDRIYKSALNVTEEWKRESARLAALLEETDNSFAGISDTIDRLSLNYQSTPAPSKLKDEIEILISLLDLSHVVDEKNLMARLKLARIHNLIGAWEKTIEILDPVLDIKPGKEVSVAALKRECGYALCCLDKGKGKTGFKERGLTLLHEAQEMFEKHPSSSKDLALTCKYLGDCEEARSAEHYLNAHRFAPGNPYYYTGLLVHQFRGGAMPVHSSLQLFSSKLEEVAGEFTSHISLGIEVAEAYLGLGKILYLQSDFDAAVAGYAKLISLVLRNEIALSKEILIREIDNLDKIEAHHPFQAEILKGLVHLLMWMKYGDQGSEAFLMRFKSRETIRSKKVLVVCGRSRELDPEKEKRFRQFVEEGLYEFEGTVISGGTPVGIPGLVGSVSASYKEKGIKNFTLIGYLPKDENEDDRYDLAVHTYATAFSVLEVITYWSDILLNGINPDQVFVLGLDGGAISALEYKIALAIGARVCLVGKLGGSAGEVVNNPDWNSLSNLYNIPDDPYTMWAMLCQDKQGVLKEDEIRKLAPIVHEYYRKKRRKDLDPETATDINKYRVVMKWDKLSKSLQHSNIQQVAFMEHIFRRGGLQFQRSEQPVKFVIHKDFPERDLMAMLEHARWNAERLLDGWKYGPQKDVLKKISDCLLPWDELSIKTKSYDYDPIRNFPGLLCNIGYEVVKAE